MFGLTLNAIYVVLDFKNNKISVLRTFSDSLWLFLKLQESRFKTSRLKKDYLDRRKAFPDSKKAQRTFYKNCCTNFERYLGHSGLQRQQKFCFQNLLELTLVEFEVFRTHQIFGTF